MHATVPTPARTWPDVLVLAALLGFIDWLLLEFPRGRELGVVWFGNGLLTGWLLSRPTATWPGYLAAGLSVDVLARLLSESTLPVAMALGTADLIEACIVAVAVRRRVPDVGNPAEWVALGSIATGSTFAACAVSGLLAAGVSALLGGHFIGSFFAWYAAHVVGMVIFATATAAVHREGLTQLLAPQRRWSFIATLLLITVVTVAVFSVPYPVLFLAYLPLLLAAVRHGVAGVALGIMLFGFIGGVATAMGRGPILQVDGLGIGGHIALLQIYVAGACLLTIPVAVAIADRRRLNSRLRDSELRYRMLADYSYDIIVRMRPSGERVYVSPSARDIIGWQPEEMLGMRWSLIHPEDRERQEQTMTEVLASGEPRTESYRVRHKEGHYVWIEAVSRPIPGIGGKGMDILFTGRDITRRVAAEEALDESRRELERLATMDSLTGLANRRRFEEGLDMALRRSHRHDVPVALMYLDVDHFKHINDTNGHAAGDEVLRSFARRLTASVRATDLVARLGGDEFVVVIEDAALPAAAETVARKLIAAMCEPIAIGTRSVIATTSIGIAYANGPTTAAALLATADVALYAAKQAGRNTWAIRPVSASVSVA